MVSRSQIETVARQLGFDVLSITSAEPLPRDRDTFAAWREAGFAAGMDYMTRRPELHSTPTLLVPYAESIITLAIDYYVEAPAFSHEGRYGRVARYAWGRDYHDVVRPRLRRLAAEIEKLAGRTVRSRCFVDAVPLLERAVAARAGLGFFGKNTNLLQPRGGSWFFLSEILLDLELPVDEVPVSVSCGSCTRCLTACPTDAFDGDYRLDSRRCISYLTIEHRGVVPRELRRGLGDWVFGCDACQDVCPFNRFAKPSLWEELRPEAGAGPRLDLVELLSIGGDRAFKTRFDGTALMRPKRRGLLRNAAVVAANVGCFEAVPVLERLVKEESESLVRSHALWALGEMDRPGARRIAARVVDGDPSDEVRVEAASILDDVE